MVSARWGFNLHGERTARALGRKNYPSTPTFTAGTITQHSEQNISALN